MSKLEDLVPPVELCKLIPEGDFLDAAFAWHYTDVVGFVCRTSGCEQVSGKQWQLIQSNASRIIRARKRGEQIYPAPTLEEILQELVNLSAYRINVCKSWGEWHIDCCDNERLIEKDSVKNIATAALKLWLELKGVEDGN